MGRLSYRHMETQFIPFQTQKRCLECHTVTVNFIFEVQYGDAVFSFSRLTGTLENSFQILLILKAMIPVMQERNTGVVKMKQFGIFHGLKDVLEPY